MTNEDFLDKLIEYCTDKPHRGKYLKELKNLGVFIEDNDPQLITRNYLVNHPDICEEGRDRALKALDLEPVKPKVKKGITRYVIDVEYELDDYKKIYGDGDGVVPLGGADCGTVWAGFYKMAEGLSGTKPNGNVPINTTLVAYRTNVEPAKSFTPELLNDPSNVCLGVIK